MASNTPRIAILFHKGCPAIERITTLSTEEMASMPLGATRNDDFALDGGLATLTSGAEVLMEIEMTEKSWGRISTVFVFEPSHVVGCRVRR